MTRRRWWFALALLASPAEGAPESPAEGAPEGLTVAGWPVSAAVDVYRLAAPVVTPAAVQPAAASRPSSTRRRRVLTGLAVGAASGCVVGLKVNARYGDGPDEAAAFCRGLALIGAGVGATVGALMR